MPKLYKLTYTHKYQFWDIVEAENKADAKRTVDKEDWQGMDYLTPMGEFKYTEGQSWVAKDPVFKIEEITHDECVEMCGTRITLEAKDKETMRYIIERLVDELTPKELKDMAIEFTEFLFTESNSYLKEELKNVNIPQADRDRLSNHYLGRRCRGYLPPTH
jgi:hypothetical protein